MSKESYMCPSCGCRTKIDVEVITWARLVKRGDVVEADIDRADAQDRDWDDGSRASCRCCGYASTLSSFELYFRGGER